MTFKVKKTGIIWDIMDEPTQKRMLKEPENYELLPDKVEAADAKKSIPAVGNKAAAQAEEPKNTGGIKAGHNGAAPEQSAPETETDQPAINPEESDVKQPTDTDNESIPQQVQPEPPADPPALEAAMPAEAAGTSEAAKKPKSTGKKTKAETAAAGVIDSAANKAPGDENA